MITWNVYNEDVNRREIKIFDIFRHSRFRDNVKKTVKKYGSDRAAFAEQLRKDLMYYFWSKCEYEVVITSWPPRKDFNDSKIDVYNQVMLNFDVFVDYVLAHRKEL